MIRVNYSLKYRYYLCLSYSSAILLFSVLFPIRKKMRKIFFAFFLLCFVSGQASAIDKGTLVVEIHGFDNSDGYARVTLFDDAEAYPTKPEKGIKRLKSKISGKKARVEFHNIPFGVYAVSVHHDEDGDAEVDTNFLGIPSEDFGASNDAKGSFGPPDFEDAKFEFDKKKMVIKIGIQ